MQQTEPFPPPGGYMYQQPGPGAMQMQNQQTQQQQQQQFFAPPVGGAPVPMGPYGGPGYPPPTPGYSYGPPPPSFYGAQPYPYYQYAPAPQPERPMAPVDAQAQDPHLAAALSALGPAPLSAPPQPPAPRPGLFKKLFSGLQPKPLPPQPQPSLMPTGGHLAMGAPPPPPPAPLPSAPLEAPLPPAPIPLSPVLHKPAVETVVAAAAAAAGAPAPAAALETQPAALHPPPPAPTAATTAPAPSLSIPSLIPPPSALSPLPPPQGVTATPPAPSPPTGPHLTSALDTALAPPPPAPAAPTAATTAVTHVQEAPQSPQSPQPATTTEVQSITAAPLAAPAPVPLSLAPPPPSSYLAAALSSTPVTSTSPLLGIAPPPPPTPAQAQAQAPAPAPAPLPPPVPASLPPSVPAPPVSAQPLAPVPAPPPAPAPAVQFTPAQAPALPPNPAPAAAPRPRTLHLVIHGMRGVTADHMLHDPVVRVHVTAGGSGYIVARAAPQGTLTQALQAQLLAHVERPLLSTWNNAGDPVPIAYPYLPPAQTNPAHLVKGLGGEPLGVTWEEALEIMEDADYLQAQDATLLLEVLQMPRSFAQLQRTDRRLRDARGAHPVAWAFVKLNGPDALPLTGNLKLQLYRYKFSAAKSRARLQGMSESAYPGDVADCYFQQGPNRAKYLYPGILTVTVGLRESQPIPITKSDPAHGLRPILPIAPVSGFEVGSRALAASYDDREGGGAGASASGEQAANTPSVSEYIALKSKVARRRSEPCELPNTVLALVQGASGGVLRVRFSPSGLFLAMVYAEAEVTRVSVHTGITGKPIARFSHHTGLVYDLQWAPNDRALITASQDFSARVWEMPEGAKPGDTYRGDLTAKRVLLHPCFVYSAAFHPRDSLTALTAAYDGKIRAWDLVTAQVTFTLSAAASPLNSLCMDPQGRRAYACDSEGVVHEVHMIDGPRAPAPGPSASPLDGSFEVTAGGPLSTSLENSALEVSGPLTGLTSGQKRAVLQQRRASRLSAAAVGVGATARAAADHMHVTLHLHRSSNDMQGQNLCHVAWIEASQRLLVVSKSSRLGLFDAALLTLEKQLIGSRCTELPLQPAPSPDGAFILCGSENGRTCLWEVSSGTLFRVEHMGFGGDPGISYTWSPADHVIVGCSLTPHVPVKIFAYDPALPPVEIVAEPGTGVIAAKPENDIDADAAERRVRKEKREARRLSRARPAPPAVSLREGDPFTSAVLHTHLEQLRGYLKERGWLQAEETHLVDRADKMIPPDQREARRAAGQGAGPPSLDPGAAALNVSSSAQRSANLAPPLAPPVPAPPSNVQQRRSIPLAAMERKPSFHLRERKPSFADLSELQNIQAGGAARPGLERKNSRRMLEGAAQ